MLTELTRQCRKCGEIKPVEAFSMVGRKNSTRRRVCKACNDRRVSEWHQAHKEERLARIRSRYHENPIQFWPPERRQRANQLAILRSRALRDEVIAHYGAECVACGEAEPMFLTLDHVENDGCQMRKVHGTGSALYRWIKKHEYPASFQVLCMNCNFGKARNGGVLVKDRRLSIDGSTTIPRGSTAKRPEAHRILKTG